jgi:mitochondrial import inner membrane translocase subunit TIM16
MAVGPLARMLAQLVVPVIAVLARALPAAYQQALQNARKSGMDANNPSVQNILRKTLSKSEALQILNISETEATTEAIHKVSTWNLVEVPLNSNPRFCSFHH